MKVGRDVMAEPRQVILIPADRDAMPEHRQYWVNFVKRVGDALERDGLDVQIRIVEPRERSHP
jgi:hypothetical protein